MVRNFNMERLFDILFNFFDLRISKFKHQAGFGIDKMVMLLEFVGPLELGTVISELVLGNQVAVQQQLNCIVQRCTANPVLVVLHADIEGLDIEMPVGVVNFLENGKPLRGFTMAALFKVFREDFLDCFK